MIQIDKEIEDTLTYEEQQKINLIQVVSLNKKEKPFSVWNVFDIFKNVEPIGDASQKKNITRCSF